MQNAIFITLVINLFLTSTSWAQFPVRPQLAKDPWSITDLMAPSNLAAMIKNQRASKLLILNIGVVENIKGARNMGAASEKENLDRFKKALLNIPKMSKIVVYCGCCPFDRCPNIRPAFTALKAGGFKNGKILNLPTNIKVDWINKGYPIE
jgi:hypothetical protein